MRVVARRLVTRRGELDLVCRADELWIGVEVKTGRAGPVWTPGMRVGRAQLARLHAAARELGRHVRARVRLDLVEVIVAPPARPRVLHHTDLLRTFRCLARG